MVFERRRPSYVSDSDSSSSRSASPIRARPYSRAQRRSRPGPVHRYNSRDNPLNAETLRKAQAREWDSSRRRTRGFPAPGFYPAKRRFRREVSSDDDEDDDDEEFGGEFAYEEVEAKGLSYSYSLPRIPQQRKKPEWEKFKSGWEQGRLTLQVIQASEYMVNKDGEEKIRLVCLGDADLDTARASDTQFKWLHLQHQDLSLDVFKTLVTDLPLITDDLRIGAIKALDLAQKRTTTKSRISGSGQPDLSCAVRFLGQKKSDPEEEPLPVMFISSPYLILADRSTGSKPGSSHGVTSLLQTLYGGYEDGHNIGGDIFQKTSGPFERGVHVPQIMCLLVGSGLLITYSEHSSKDLQGDLVEVDQKTSPLEKSLVVHLVFEESRDYNLVINAKSSYVDFLREALAMVKTYGLEATDYEICDDDGSTITPQHWLGLLETGELEKQTIHLRLKDAKEEMPFDRVSSPERDRPGVRYEEMPPKRRRSHMVDPRLVERRGSRPFQTRNNSMLMELAGARVDRSRLPTRSNRVVNYEEIDSKPPVFNWNESSDEPKENTEHKESTQEEHSRFEMSPPQSPGSEHGTQKDVLRGQAYLSTIRETSYHEKNEHRKQSNPSLEPSTDVQASTRLPLDRVSTQTIEQLGYSFHVKGDNIVIHQDLDSASVEKIMRLSDFNRDWRSYMEISQRPFLTWGENQGESASSVVDSKSSSTRVLNHLHKLLSESKISRLYARAFPCTLEELLQRHQYLQDNSKKGSSNETNRPGTSTTDIVPLPANPPTEGATALEKEDTKSRESNHLDVETTKSDGSPRNLAGDPVQDESTRLVVLRHHEVIRELFKVSKNLLEDFLPKDDVVLNHKLSKSFWGILDAMLRHVAWSIADRVQPASWVIAKFPDAMSGKKAFDNCEECTANTEYPSYVEALKHLHSQHMECSNPPRPESPSEDSCFVWLKPTSVADGNHPSEYSLIASVKRFVEVLRDITKLTYELHCLVASVSKSPVKSSPPNLPSTLVYAFEAILEMYIEYSRHLFVSAKALERSGSGRVPPDALRELELIEARLTEGCFRIPVELLRKSKLDIIVLETTHDLDIVGLDAIGPEFLVAALIINIQNRSIIPGQFIDAVGLYRDHMSKLRYQAARRPDRRVILNLHRLQDELEALKKLNAAQKTALSEYRELLSPRSFRVTNANRIGLFEIEEQYINVQFEKLAAQKRDVSAMHEKASVMRDRVKQTIDILEEDHGKAIRVFTIVTLFFLPLSFTTSFFGMNTTDVRDTEYDQRMFWAVSVPITVVVLGIAYLYAYKMDAITDGIEASLKGKGRKHSLAQKPKLAPRKEKPVRSATLYSNISAMENGFEPGSESKNSSRWLDSIRKRGSG